MCSVFYHAAISFLFGRGIFQSTYKVEEWHFCACFNKQWVKFFSGSVKRTYRSCPI